MRDKRRSLKRAGLLLAATLRLASASPAAPDLTPDQIHAAIAHGSRFATQEKYFQKGLKVKRQVDLVTVGMSSRYVVAFGDWDIIAAQSALARQQMKPFSASDVQLTGNLHVLMKAYNPGAKFSDIHSRYGTGQANMVLQIGDLALQPVKQEILSETEIASTVGSAWLLYHFEVQPESLGQSVLATFIDAKGKRNSRKIDLSGVLAPPR